VSPSLLEVNFRPAPKTVTRSDQELMRTGDQDRHASIHCNACRRGVVPAKRAARQLVRSPSGARKTGARKPELARKTGGGAVLQNWVGLTPVNQAYYSSVLLASELHISLYLYLIFNIKHSDMSDKSMLAACIFFLVLRVSHFMNRRKKARRQIACYLTC
jgi:hypothetical protein